jgi:hypothetical protein
MPFQLPNQTSFAIAKPTYSGSTWVRPADWITITDTAGEVQFLVSDVVYPVYSIQTQFTRPGSENIYIDWGDGTIDTISTTTATITNHTYTSGGTPSTQGYNTWKVRIYGDVGTTITDAQQINNTTYWGASPIGQAGTLEAVYGNGTIGSINLTNYFSAQLIVRQNFLQYIKLPSTITSASLNATFRGCIGLQQIIMPTSAANISSTQDTFFGCVNLIEVILPYDMVNIVSMSSMFNNCQGLQNVRLPETLNLVQALDGLFNNCFSLGSIQIPQLNSCYGFNTMFQNCVSLLNVEIKTWGTDVYSGGTTFNLTSMFAGCVSLEDVKLPTYINPSTRTQIQTLFQNCRALKTFTFPSNLNCESMLGTFQNCSSLSNVVMPSSIPLLNNLSSAFNNCSQLANISLPTTSAASISLIGVFQGASALSEIVIPSGYVVNGMTLAFQNCYSVKKITLPNVMTITSLANLFNGCYSLEEVIMPTTINSNVSLLSIFANCSKLKSIVFPSTMTTGTLLTTAFQNCSSITGITFPPSMTLQTGVNTFQNCSSLKSITLPNPLGVAQNYSNMFNNCNSIETITISPVAQTGLIASGLGNFLNGVENLTTLNNEEYLGNSGTTSTIYHDGTGFLVRAPRLQSLDLRCKWSRFVAAGTATLFNGLTSLRLRNNGSGQYAGTSPQIDIKYNKLGQAALVDLFNDLPTITSKTIDITANPGASLLTPAERAIATGKGWTIVG